MVFEIDASSKGQIKYDEKKKEFFAAFKWFTKFNHFTSGGIIKIS